MFTFGISRDNPAQSLGVEAMKQNPAGEEDRQVFHELQTILNGKSLKAVFQPILSLADAAIVGYEALSRGPQGSILERPDALFPAAERFDKVWELEFLCRAKALEKARQMMPDKMLFINVAPHIIKDSRFQKGITRELLEQCGINADNIIFEITEKTSVEDYKSFRRVLDNYTSQGYKIAIDDTGSGYSGLKMLAETRPQFIKIDMDLVRDIDKDALKQALMKAFSDFSIIMNMKIIAEGIETADELNTLIRIGIPYGQGYLLQKPAPEFLEIHPRIRDLIRTQNRQKRKAVFHTPLTIPIGDIARQDGVFSPDATGCQVIDYFNSHPNVLGVTIVQAGKPTGLLMKDKFFTQLATQYGVAVYMNRSVHLLMDKHPLIVDYQTSLEQVSKFAVSRSEDRLYDYIIITQNDQYYGITTVKQLLEKTTQLEVNQAKFANPLSGLPGNIIIEEKLKQAIETEESFSVLYFDLDNFKAYNDVYGFENGDKILRMTASIIQ
ncbi:MAG: EAL domain-containing protein, partial [Veillonellales bacterium]